MKYWNYFSNHKPNLSEIHLRKKHDTLSVTHKKTGLRSKYRKISTVKQVVHRHLGLNIAAVRVLAYSVSGYHGEMSRATSSATGSRAYCSKNDGPGHCCSPQNASGTDRTSQSVDTSHRVRFFRMQYIFHMKCDSRSVTQKKSSYGIIINKYMLRNGQKTWVTELVSIVAACKNRQKNCILQHRRHIQRQINNVGSHFHVAVMQHEWR